MPTVNKTYTETLVAALQAQQVWTYAEATAFAEENGLKSRSVIAKLKSMGLDYIPKPVVAKTGEPVERKGEVIAEIETALNVETGAFSGLSKSTKAALNALRSAIQASSSDA